MGRTIKAIYSGGFIRPVEHIDWEDGKEIYITIDEDPTTNSSEFIKETTGAWEGVVDCEKLKRDIRQSRMISTRPADPVRKTEGGEDLAHLSVS